MLPLQMALVLAIALSADAMGSVETITPALCINVNGAGAHASAPASPYPFGAAGWGPEAGKGRMASQWAEDWATGEMDQAAAEPDATPSIQGASIKISTELRVREVVIGNKGLVPGESRAQTQLRAIMGADLHMNPNLRIFGEIGTGQVNDERRQASASFQNRASLQQLFADVRETQGALMFGAVIGRQEFSDGPKQLISLSDGPNLHRTWNGILAYAHGPHFRLGMFDFRATNLAPGSFDDGIQSSRTLSGVVASFIALSGSNRNAHLDPFWYRTTIPIAHPVHGAGLDQRNTLGLRLWGRNGPASWDWTIAGQSGRSSSGQGISAWGLFAVQSLGISENGWKPRLTSHLDIASGDAEVDDNTTQTFHPLYSSSSYLGEGQFLGLSNLILFAPGMVFTPSKQTALSLEYGYARRLDTGDAVYANGLRAYSGTQGLDSRHIGNLARVSAAWSASSRLSFKLVVEQFKAGDALKAAGFDDGVHTQLTFSHKH